MKNSQVSGTIGQAEALVAETKTVARLGSGPVPVFGTPTLVCFLMENATIRALKGRLVPEQASISARIELDHLAPTPVGTEVNARTKLVSVDGRRRVSEIEAFEEIDMSGGVKHERVLVSSEKFLSKDELKRSQSSHSS